MKVGDRDASIFMGDQTRSRRHEQGAKEKNKASVKKGSIFMGDLKAGPDNILLKRQSAQKKALKLVMDTHAGEMKVDQGIQEMHDKIQSLKDSSEQANKEINSFREDIRNLKEEYGVSDDRQEQKDLELLIKKQKSQKLDSDVTLTEEEEKRIKEMGEPTEYQERVLGYESLIEERRSVIDSNSKQIGMIGSSIDSTKREQEKSHAMIDAVNTADSIEKAASKEIMGMLIQEAKEHLDEEIKKKEEEAKKLAEKKAEEEEKKEKLEEKKDQQTELTEGIKEHVKEETVVPDLPVSDPSQGEIQQKLKKLLDEEKLLEEDLKGITMDELM